jgi:hypothetical protein
VQLLVDAGVDFVLIGGLALAAHGSALDTRDTDVMYNRDLENIYRLAAALGVMDVRLRGIDEELPFKPDARTIRAGSNFTFDSSFGPIDVLGEVAGISSYAGLRDRAGRAKWGEQTVLVASIDDLIAMKTAAGRSKDLRALDDLAWLKKLGPDREID